MLNLTQFSMWIVKTSLKTIYMTKVFFSKLKNCVSTEFNFNITYKKKTKTYLVEQKCSGKTNWK